jgi:hypothetical protein
MVENSTIAWPSVGQSPVAVPAHASNLKKEIRELLKYSERTGGEGGAVTAMAIPHNVFKDLSNSVLILLDKVMDQPNIKDLVEAIERVDKNTKMILTNVQSSKQPSRSSDTSPEPVSAATPAQPTPDPVAALEEDIPGLAPFPQETLERLKTLPPQTVEKIMVGRRRGAAAVLAARGQVGAGRGETSKATPSNATVIAQPGGRSSKLVLQSQTAEHGKVHEKIYSPLDKAKREIRLIKLCPDIDPEYDVRCEMSAVSLDIRPVYKALSYTWGNPNDTVPITLNGQRLAITRNLKKALQRLRNINTKTPVWIDALCINQLDPAERMHQVEMMRVIYENPNEVIVWLGDDPQPFPGDEHWDASCFHWSGDEADISSINSILAYAEAYGDTYPEQPDARSANPLMLGFCLIRLLAGDVHLTDIPLLRSINLREQCMKAFSSLVTRPWVCNTEFISALFS